MTGMDSTSTLLIVGGGLAGAKAAEAARSGGFQGRVVLVGEEARPPYERPPLSKAILRAEEDPDSSRVHDSGYYTEHNIELITGEDVTGLDVAARRAHLGSGSSITYDAVVLATGATPRPLGLPGAHLDGVHYLRTVDQSVRLHEAIKKAGRVAVIGAGWIGSEVAASARQMGAEVVLIEPLKTPLYRVLGAEVGGIFASLHAEHGVHLRVGVGVTELRGGPRGGGGRACRRTGRSGRCRRGRRWRRSQRPSRRRSGTAGRQRDRRRRKPADQKPRASSPRATWPTPGIPHFQRRLRVEHWANALNQGAAAGVNATQDPQPYTRLPYFFSDQYDVGMEYVGYATGEDDVVIRGDRETREFIAFYHQGGVVTAAMNVNVWDVVDDLRAIITAGRTLDPAQLADPSVELSSLA